VGLEPFIEQWHAFPVEITLTSTKEINIKLSLESSEIMDYGIVVGFDGKPDNRQVKGGQGAWLGQWDHQRFVHAEKLRY